MSKNKKKPRPKKKAHKSIEEDLKEDLEELNHDWEDIFSKKELLKNDRFLNKLAHDIKQLNDDTIVLEDTGEHEATIDLIHHMLTTPWGAPFVSNRTLLEAAMAYEYQEPINSDLFQLVKDFTKYSPKVNNPLITVLHSLSKELEED